ncbi:MAG: DUF1801 domain-containing protein [Bacteroidetes bacterium]|nr:DUF1801 domain-containing protein [Bacteroidota bacterium]
MQTKETSPDDYFANIPEARKPAMNKLRQTILNNLSEGFAETISYGMVGYIVPHSVYPGGYHCNPKEPLPFISIASQKNFIALYHMGIYANKELLDWFLTEYPKHSKAKLDMGKSCIRFIKPDEIPYELIGELTGKMSSEKWIEIYESQIKR